jgi:predicted phage terminase large subunit-like protein
VETTLDPSLYYKSEARPISKLKQLYQHSHADVPLEKWLEYRDRARKDLFWLGKLILRKDLTHCHVIPCRHLFVQKNFDGVYHEDYTIGEVHKAIDKQPREKDMLWLDPRGAFKSTLDGIDCVQWLLNCPDMRILILTGEYKLALAFMREIKGYFYRPSKKTQDKISFTADPTLLQQLFPEYIITGTDGESDQPLECPARVHNQVAPSVWCNAIVANLSGWHCDLRKMDDVVTDENSNSVDARGPEGKLKMKIDGTDNLVDEWGFTDSVGTRYYTDDYYGERIKAAAGPDAPLRYLCRACWTVKPGFETVPLLSIKSEMVDLLFPEKLTFKSLRQKLSKNQIMFRCQQLNEPAGDLDAITFSEDVLRAHIVSKAPLTGKKFIAWDTSYARESTADYSAGVCGMVVTTEDNVSELHLVEIIYGKWKPSELAFQIIQFELKHRPISTLIEEMNGAEFLKVELNRLASQRQCPLNINWKKASTAADSKRNRIKSLETLLNDDRLFFIAGNWIDETFLQFTRYTGERKNKGRKDDIPDAIAYLQFFVPSTANNEELKAAQYEREQKEKAQAAYNRIFEPAWAPKPVYQPPSIKRQLFGSLARD